jgi:hypothetical protein
MKSNLKLLSLIGLSFIIVFGSCRRDQDPSPEEQKLEDLSGTWNIVSANVNNDNVAITGGVSINFNASNTTYSVTGLQAFTDANLNYDETLAASGSFSLNENLDVLTLSPGGNLNIGSINKENGDLTLSYSSPYPKENNNAVTITLNLELQ